MKKLTEEHKRKIGLALRGRVFTEEHKRNLWKGRERMSDEKHPLWKGPQASYKSIHAWVARKLGKPNICAHCGGYFSGRKINWANISGDYSRDLSDWIRLCRPCHDEFDYNKGRGRWPRNI